MKHKDAVTIDHGQVTPVLGVSDQCYAASMEYIHGELNLSKLILVTVITVITKC